MRSLVGKLFAVALSSSIVVACANAGEVTFDEPDLNAQGADAATKADVVTSRDSGNNSKPDTGGGVPDSGGGVPDSGGGIPDTGGGVPDTGGGQTGGACDPNEQSYAAKYIIELLNPSPIMCTGGTACPSTHCCYLGALCLPL
jgi:hypothetical protein